ncbi:MAG: NAD(P)H-hydrate dehydratase [Chitinispirillaceae bacterium]|nr:NAD(P)H-hydrate dehydratase [Chitinispirillaceae bacterium]
MTPVLTIAQMRSIDEAAIGNDLHIGYSYMLKAGMGLYLAARELLPDPSGGEIAVVCGKGNNGGDGYVAARLLCEAGYRVMCYSLCATDELRGEAKNAFDEYAGRKGNVLVPDDAGELSFSGRYRLIIDAMLGTGARGDPHGLCAMAIDAINSSGLPVLAVDIPSGLDADTGVPNTPCVRATFTVALGFPKIGQYWYPGRELLGRLRVHDLGYPDEIVQAEKCACVVPEPHGLSKLLPRRKPAGSKFDHGLALLVCGSRGMTGSAVLASIAAMRTGCGMTHLAAASSIVEPLSNCLTETVVHPLAETAAGSPGLAALPRIRELAPRMQALCIGPGISHEPETSALVREVIATVPLPTVLDADGINAFKGEVEALRQHAGDLVLTPHRGEWQRLFGELPSSPAAIIDAVRSVAARFQVTVLLKGSPGVLVDPRGRAVVLPFGNSALAKAGTGDVLCGMIVSLVAQGASVTDAAILGAYLHGEAGVRASRTLGEYSVLAGDVAENIPQVIVELLAQR